MREVQTSLPEGVEIVPTYDRSGLIRESIATLRETLIEEGARRVVRGPGVPVPLPIGARSRSSRCRSPSSASFIPMYYLGVTSNIMSLGGIALAIGELVDASIVMVENAYRRISEPAEGRDGPSPYEEQPREVVAAAQQVGRAIFFSLAIIIVSFVPVFLLEAQEGRMFRPLAYTKTFAMASATVLSITLVPVLMTLFLRGRRLQAGGGEPVLRGCRSPIYEPVLRAGAALEMDHARSSTSPWCR